MAGYLIEPLRIEIRDAPQKELTTMKDFYKKLISLPALLVLGGWFSQALAQEGVFKVLATRGDCQAKTASGKGNITIGKKLASADVVELTAGSYLGLMHKSGKTVEIKAAGVYQVSELETKLASSGSSVSSKYASYVFGQMANSEGADLKKNHQQYMAVTGAVMRATASGATPINLFIPEKAPLLSSSTYHLTWMLTPGVKEYLVTVLDLSGSPIHSQTVSDTAVNINFGSLAALKEDGACNIVVSAKNNPKILSREITLNLANGAKSAKVEAELKALNEEHDPSSAIGLLVQANYLEEEGFTLDALNAYRLASFREPGVDTFHNAYRDFLIKHGLIRPATDETNK